MQMQTFKKAIGWFTVVAIVLLVIYDIWTDVFELMGWHAIWATPIALVLYVAIIFAIVTVAGWAFKKD